MKMDGPDVPFPETTKSGVPLNTMPVGAEGPVLPRGGGILTERNCEMGVPSFAKSLERPVPLVLIQKGLVGPFAMPQGLTRFLSVTTAVPGISDTRFACAYF